MLAAIKRIVDAACFAALDELQRPAAEGVGRPS